MKVHVLSLGCARNLVDSEGLAGLLEQAGHRFTDRVDEAECVVVNTCSFIREAEEESISAILDIADRKKKGKLRRLYVAGCLPQKRRNEKKDLLDLLPEVDGFLGPGDLPKLPGLIEEQEGAVISNREAVRDLVPKNKISRPNGLEMTKDNRFFLTSPVPTLLFDSATPKHRLTPKHYAYLKISEGCDHACTFCSIPQFRGAHRSRTIEDLVEEAARLVSEGVVELNLIGQDTSYYGADRYGAPSLPKLLEELAKVKGVRWIRILYAHPAHVTDDLIHAIRDLQPVVKYVDIPLQHISDRLLSLMRRETDGATLRRLIDRFRSEVPGMAIRTTFIAGFPGETEQEVEELAGFLRQARFERVGIFLYSPEPKTPSEKMPDPLPEAVKQDRRDMLMSIQREISEEMNQRWLGKEIEVLVDEAQGERVYLGRTYADAPEVDGQVFLNSRAPLHPGRMVRARVTDTTEYDLVAEPVAG